MKIGDTFVSEPNLSAKPSKVELEQAAMDRLAAFNKLHADDNLSDEEKEINALPLDQQKYVRENQGIGGSLKVGAESAGNELLFGLPEIAYKKFGDPSDVAQYEALKHFHPTANVVGGIGGALGSLAIGGPLFKGAAEAGRLAEGAVLGSRGAEELSLARTIASKLVGGAAEGAVIGAPQTVGNAVFGNPKEAAENLIFSAGLGGLLGPAKFGISKGIESGAEIGSAKLGELGQSLSKDLELGGEKTKEKITEMIGDNIKEAFKLAGLHSAGLPGLVVGKGIGALSGSLAEKALGMLPEEYITKGLQATLKANKLGQDQLNKIPEILDGLSKSGFGKAVAASGSIFGETGKDIAGSKNDYESFEKLSKKLADNQATLKNQEIIGNNSAGLNHNQEIQNAYQESALNAVNYLQSVIPKNPNPVIPFSPNKWQPSDIQLKQFKSQLDIVHNPYVVLNKLQTGTLTRADVTTLQNVYPAIYSKMTNEILKHATDPKYSNVSYSAKAKLSLLTGIPMDQSFNSNTINTLQSDFTAQPSNEQNNTSQSKGSKKALDKNPPLTTELQNISFGNPGSSA